MFKPNKAIKKQLLNALKGYSEQGPLNDLIIKNIHAGMTTGLNKRSWKKEMSKLDKIEWLDKYGQQTY